MAAEEARGDPVLQVVSKCMDAWILYELLMFYFLFTQLSVN